MRFELCYWNVMGNVKRRRWIIGYVILCFFLIAQSASLGYIPGTNLRESLGNNPISNTILVCGDVYSLTIIQILMTVMHSRSVYGNGSIHFLFRSQNRVTYWSMRVISTFIASALLCACLIGTNLLLNAVVTHLVRIKFIVTMQASVLSQTQDVFIIYILLSLGMSTVVLLMDIFQLIVNSSFLALLPVIILQIVSNLSYSLFNGKMAHAIFLFSPFLRQSLIANSTYHNQPIDSILFFLIVLIMEWWIGRMLILKKDIS